MFNLFSIAHAETASKVLEKNPAIKTLMGKIMDNIISPIVGVMFLLAFVLFVYGIFGMISSSDDSDKRNSGKRSILWGVIGMVIMLSVFGIIRLIAATVGVENPL